MTKMQKSQKKTLSLRFCINSYTMVQWWVT